MKGLDSNFDDIERRQNGQLLIITLLIFFCMGAFAFGFAKGQHHMEKISVERGHAVFHDGEFRWLNCKMGYMTKN